MSTHDISSRASRIGDHRAKTPMISQIVIVVDIDKHCNLVIIQQESRFYIAYILFDKAHHVSTDLRLYQCAHISLASMLGISNE